MPRSGTSLTAAVFNRHGLFTGHIEGTNTRDGDSLNPFGYFEATDVVERNVDVLRGAGFPAHNTWSHEEIQASAVDRLVTLEPLPGHRAFLESYNEHSPWLWKDPRLCYTLGYWWKLMDPATTAVVVIHRDPMQIYRSFLRMGWCKSGAVAREGVLRRIDAHMRAAAEAVRSLQIPALEIHYRDYQDDPEGLAQRMGDHCGLVLRTEDLNFRPELNHSTVRGRLSHLVWRSRRGLLRPFAGLERVLPRRIVGLLFPERKYLKK